MVSLFVQDSARLWRLPECCCSSDIGRTKVWPCSASVESGQSNSRQIRVSWPSHADHSISVRGVTSKHWQSYEHAWLMLPAADVQAPQSSCCSVKYSSVFVQAHIQRGDLLLIQMIYQFVSMINKCNVGNVCLRSDIETVKHSVRNVTITAAHYSCTNQAVHQSKRKSDPVEIPSCQDALHKLQVCTCTHRHCKDSLWPRNAYRSKHHTAWRTSELLEQLRAYTKPVLMTRRLQPTDSPCWTWHETSCSSDIYAQALTLS